MGNKRGKRGPYKFTEARRKLFLKIFKETGAFYQTVKSVGVCAETIKRTLLSDPEFRQKYMEAKDEIVEKLEQEAMRRGVDGVLRPVFQGGKKVGDIREYSDTLLIFLLKGLNPEVYGERFRHEGNIKHDHEHSLDPLLEAKFNEIVEHRRGTRLLPDLSGGSEESRGEGEKDEVPGFN